VSGDGEDKVLGVPKLAAGKAEEESKAVYDHLAQWDLTEKVQAMCFDTTSVNTGLKSGVCIRLEGLLNRQLLWLACRHHMMELILAKVFSLCFGSSKSPDIPILKRFRSSWSKVNCDDYKVMVFDNSTVSFVASATEFFTEFTNYDLLVRDDYREVLELTMLVIGVSPERVHWRAPGPVHHARWMAKLIYALKMYLFRHQRNAFALTAREQQQLQRFVQFGVLIYAQVWLQAPLAIEAPGLDLGLWKCLERYKAVDNNLASTAQKVLENHLWYLSHELVGLALFS
jgi:hypothetical protein